MQIKENKALIPQVLCKRHELLSPRTKLHKAARTFKIKNKNDTSDSVQDTLLLLLLLLRLRPYPVRGNSATTVKQERIQGI